MMLLLMRQNLLHLPAAMFAGLMLAAVLVSPESGPLLVAPLVGMVPMLALGRPELFTAAMPVHARTVRLARILAHTLLTLGPLVVWAAVTIYRPVDDWIPVSVAEVFVLASVVMLLPELRLPRDRAIPAGLAAFAMPLVALLWWLLFESTTAETRRLLEIVALGAMLLTLAWQLVRVPAASLLATGSGVRRATTTVAADERTQGTASEAGRMGVRGWTSLFWSTQPRVLFAMTVTFGAMAALTPSMMFPAMMLTSYLQVQPVHASWTHVFPLSHTQRLHMLLLMPILMLLALGVAAHVWLEGRQRMDDNAPYTEQPEGARWYKDPTQLSLLFWDRTHTADGPVVVAPWGESVVADTLRVPGALMFNPYTTRAGSSERFVAWQFARATSAVYGAPVSREAYERGEHPPRATYSTRMQLLQGSAFLAAVLAFHSLGLLVRQLRPRVVTAAFLLGLLPVVPFFAEITIDWSYGMERGTKIVVPLVQRALLHLDRALPDSIAPVILLALLPLVAMYLLLGWQIRRIEAGRLTAPPKSPIG